MPYLFAHFREKITQDGEQVYFAISRDGYNYNQLNGGKPIITCTDGEMGCRDIEVVRLKKGGFVIVATDLCIVNRMDENYNVDWENINHNGSKSLSMWFSPDLTSFSPQRVMYMGRDDLGCLWAPEVYYDEENEEYLIHFSSTVKEDDYKQMSIYCSKTKDFISFTKPELFFKADSNILDSHIVKIGDTYHFFYKHANRPSGNMHETSEKLYGPYKHDEAFDKYIAQFEKPGSYEAPTTCVLPDGKWCLLLDFFGCEKEKMGYVPFLSEKAGEADFREAKEKFSFPYGFKHGHPVEITDEEYDRLAEFYGIG